MSAPEPNKPSERLEQSYRQSVRELIFILVAWTAFAVWIIGTGALLAYHSPDEEVQILFGMPRWVLVSVALPWLAAIGLIFWFALRFMKDTDLGDSN